MHKASPVLMEVDANCVTPGLDSPSFPVDLRPENEQSEIQVHPGILEREEVHFEVQYAPLSKGAAQLKRKAKSKQSSRAVSPRKPKIVVEDVS